MERRFNTPGTPTIEVRLPAGRVEISTHDGDETIVQLKALRDKMLEFQRTHGDFWKPAPLLNRLADEGKTFTQTS